MNSAVIIKRPECKLRETSKKELIRMVLSLREQLEGVKTESEAKQAASAEKIAALEAELEKIKQQDINKTANQPSSKQPEFDKDTGPKVKRKRGKGRPGRPGAGNRPKPKPDVVNENPLNHCPECNEDLTKQPVIETTSRTVEDIPPPPEKTIVSEERQERKWCQTCKKTVASVSEAALPRSDIGLNSLIMIAYFWVVSAISLPGIAAFLGSFFRLSLSTAGLSRMMIRLSCIMAPVYEEILQDVKIGTVIFADETGWHVKGILWWLWIFGNKRSAYYWASEGRGSAVVEKVLGAIFSGVLVTDAWGAYKRIICAAKQTCMAHIMRKIRKFRDAYPQYYSILRFYQKLKRLLSDAEKLKLARKELGEAVFSRRLGLLKERLNKLLAWKNPNAILKEVIAKVARQKDYILTFVEYKAYIPQFSMSNF